MSDAKVEGFKKSVTKSADTWGKDLDKTAKQIEELQKQRQAIEAQINTAYVALQKDFVKFDVPADADEKELARIQAWYREIVTKKLSPLSKSMTMSASTRFDGNPKKLIVSLGWSWKGW